MQQFYIFNLTADLWLHNRVKALDDTETICCFVIFMRGGGNSLIKVGMDVQQVQNLDQAKFPQKT